MIVFEKAVRRCMPRRVLVTLNCSFFLITLCPFQASSQVTPEDLTSVSLEQLMNVEVTSVSKKQQKLQNAPAAIFVITQEDIRRSGATSIPEVLRLVPGVHVARINAHTWAISSRGFNDKYNNKMLVLIDGRSVYTPLFSGVYWDIQDTLLEDIERIEVIRGPGATVWGANAVNGVINVITKSSAETQGGVLSAGGGDEERGFGGARYGSQIGSRGHYRVYSKFFNRNSLLGPNGSSAGDPWEVFRAGFRSDWKLSNKNALTVQGDLYEGRTEQLVTDSQLSAPFRKTFPETTHLGGGNALVRWSHSSSDDSQMELQVYYDRTARSEFNLGLDMQALDIDLNLRRRLSARHELQYGLGYRFTTDDTRGSFQVSFVPAARSDNLFSGFVQDEIHLAENWLSLTVGSKFEHNSYSGFEIEPGARLMWTPDPRHSVWIAVSRAVRTPSRSDSGLRVATSVFPTETGLLEALTLRGNRSIRSETLLAYELGYRIQPNAKFALDIASFYNFYGDLISNQAAAPFLVSSPAPTHLVLPLNFLNKLDGHTVGMEMTASWSVKPAWKLSSGYSWLHLAIPVAASDAATNRASSGRNPAHQFHFQSLLNLPRNMQFDTTLYYVGSLPAIPISSYTRLDTRLGWQPTRDLDLCVCLQNLLDDRHEEFVDTSSPQRTRIGRSVFGRVTWRF